MTERTEWKPRKIKLSIVQQYGRYFVIYDSCMSLHSKVTHVDAIRWARDWAIQRKKDFPGDTVELLSMDDTPAYQFESVPDVEARFASEDATIAELLQVIRSVEWIPDVERGDDYAYCPMCHKLKGDGHGLDCRLAKALEDK